MAVRVWHGNRHAARLVLFNLCVWWHCHISWGNNDTTGRNFQPSITIFKAVLSIWAGWLYIFESLLIWMWRDTVLIGHIGPNALIICAGPVQARAEHTLGKLTSSQNDPLWENTGTRWKSIADNPLISSPKMIIFVLFFFLETHNLNFWRILLEHFFKPIKVNEKMTKKAPYSYD